MWFVIVQFISSFQEFTYISGKYKNISSDSGRARARMCEVSLDNNSMCNFAKKNSTRQWRALRSHLKLY
jgi:hypothetical protein